MGAGPAPAPVLDAVARRLDGVRIAYDAVPGDRPIVLVHGFASTARVSWTGTGWVRFLEEAGRGVVLPDLRGHGRSDKPHRAPDYEPRQMAADLVVVLDALGLDQVDVVAYSMGSRVAAALATLVPDRVRRLVLGGAGPVELFESWDRETMTRFLAGETPVDPMIAAVLAAAVGAGGDRTALLACVEGFAGAALDVPPGIPVLYVAGGADPIPAGVADLARARGAAYRELPGRDHLNALVSREFMQAALEFLA